MSLTDIPDRFGPAMRVILWTITTVAAGAAVERFSKSEYGQSIACTALFLIFFVIAVKWERIFSWLHPKQSKLAYLQYKDAELGPAIRDMATYSAWAKWFASQSLATNNHQPILQQNLMHIASSVVLDALVDGKLHARGRPSGGIEYEEISREAWRLVAIHMQPHPASLWRGVIISRGNVRPERIVKLLDYDSIIVDAHEFETLWPQSSRWHDKARMKLLKTAAKVGADPEHVERLSQGHMATWP